WGVLEAHLAGRRYVAADRITIADLSICGYLFFDDEIGVDWEDYPAIQGWLGRIKSEPRWAHPYQLMPGHPRPATVCRASCPSSNRSSIHATRRSRATAKQ